MSTHQRDIDRARDQIRETTKKADSYLTNLTKRVEEYENSHKSFEPAGEFLKSALDASRSATQKLKIQGEDLSERSVPVALEGMHAVRESMDTLEKQAAAYDDKYTGSSGSQAVSTMREYVNVGRQHATDAIESANEQLMKLRDAIGNMAGQATHGAQVVVGEAVRVAEFGDEKLGVSSVAGGVVQKVRDLDARLGVTAVAAKVDSTITGGLGSKMAATTVDIVTESVNYISETLHNAKLAAQHSEIAQSIEATGSSVTGAAVAKKNEVQQTFTNAVEKGKETIGMATEKTEEKAGEVKNLAAEKAGQTKEMAEVKAGEVKDNTGEMTDTAKDKAGEATETAKQKGGEMVGAAKDKAEQVKDEAVKMTEKVKTKGKAKAGKAAETVKGKSGSKG